MGPKWGGTAQARGGVVPPISEKILQFARVFRGAEGAAKNFGRFLEILEFFLKIFEKIFFLDFLAFFEKLFLKNAIKSDFSFFHPLKWPFLAIFRFLTP